MADDLPKGLSYGDPVSDLPKGLEAGPSLGGFEERVTKKIGARYDKLRRRTEEFENLAGDPIEGITRAELDLSRSGFLAGSLFDVMGEGINEVFDLGIER